MEKVNLDLVLKVWENFAFNGFSIKDNKVSEWKKYSLQILEKIDTGNVGLIADTGTGKTIMAILVIEALNLKTVFLAPTVILVNQHADLYKKITGKEATVITGNQKKRDWGTSQLVIATPHVFQVEEKNNLVSEDWFDLLVIDELHKGQGKYPYVKLTNNFKEKGKRIIALSASPGSDDEKIKKMESLYEIQNWITAEITMPKKNYRVIRCPLSQAMKIADESLKSMAFTNLQRLNSLFNLSDGKKIIDFSLEEPFLTKKTNHELEDLIKRLSGKDFYQAKSLFAKQYKINHLFKLLMTEGYFSFLQYAEKSLARDTSQASKSLLADSRWRKLYYFIKELAEKHPKEEALLLLIKEMYWKNKKMLIFINNKVTASYLSEKLNQIGYRSETLFGGQSKSAQKNTTTINRFLDHQLDILIATSVVEEGLSLPEIDVVIHYAQPMTEITRLQRDGRTGRFSEGLVCFILTDIDYENSIYFATMAKLKKMKQIFYQSAREEENRKRVIKKYILYVHFT